MHDFWVLNFDTGRVQTWKNVVGVLLFEVALLSLVHNLLDNQVIFLIGWLWLGVSLRNLSLDQISQLCGDFLI